MNFGRAKEKLDNAKHKVLDFVDMVRADSKKQLAAVGGLMFVIGFAFAKLF